MLSNFNWDYEAAATAYCGLEAVITTPDGLTATLYIADAFDDTWVRTPASIDVMYDSVRDRFAADLGIGHGRFSVAADLVSETFARLVCIAVRLGHDQQERRRQGRQLVPDREPERPLQVQGARIGRPVRRFAAQRRVAEWMDARDELDRKLDFLVILSTAGSGVPRSCRPTASSQHKRDGEKSREGCRRRCMDRPARSAAAPRAKRTRIACERQTAPHTVGRALESHSRRQLGLSSLQTSQSRSLYASTPPSCDCGVRPSSAEVHRTNRLARRAYTASEDLNEHALTD